MRTTIGIIGAGPAGLFLGHLLDRAGIDSVILEARSRAHVEGRIRAGVLEDAVVRLLRETGLGARMDREGLGHEGFAFHFAGRSHRIDLAGLTGGKRIMVYGQHEMVKDMIAARLAAGGAIRFEAEATGIDGLDGPAPTIRFREPGGAEQRLACALVAGCDGFHGVSRAALAPGAATICERSYPFGWLGVLARTPPPSPELIYASHEHGFALASMRTPAISRLYLQCAPDEGAETWRPERVWPELRARLGCSEADLAEGEVLQQGVTALRSFVVEPMRFGRLVLAGDAAHIVPPTGAKGMNLAIADVWVLARAIWRFLHQGQTDLLDAYSATCLARIWKVQRFSWWMTSILHRFESDSPFDRRRRLAELDYIVSSRAAMTALAENYVGLPIED